MDDGLSALGRRDLSEIKQTDMSMMICRSVCPRRFVGAFMLSLAFLSVAFAAGL